MEAKAIARHVRVTPRKARRMVDLIRGKRATDAITILKFAPQSAALPVRKTLRALSPTLREADKAGEPFRENDLFIKETYVDEGVTLKLLPRFVPSGRAARINKRTSHITVVVASKEGAR